MDTTLAADRASRGYNGCEQHADTQKGTYRRLKVVQLTGRTQNAALTTMGWPGEIFE
jgi:hypothetical protein